MTGPVIEAINLEAFEKLVFGIDGTPQSFESAARELASILQKVRADSGFFGLADPERQLPVLYTRLAGAISTLFCNPKFQVSPEGFVHLCQYHPVLHGIFRASGYETMDQVLAVIGRREEGSPMNINFSGNAVVLLLLCWSLDSEVNVDFEAIARALPDHVGAALIGILGTGGTYSKAAYERRLKLMGLRHLIESSTMHEQMLGAAGDCYMHCSYVDAPDKHDLKRVLNKKVREVIERSGRIYDMPRQLVRKDRPTILVPLEWFGSHHAMYRCYAPSILQLRKRFRVLGLVRGKEIDAGGRAVFDRVIDLPEDKISVQTIFEAIRDEAPDILFYPSVGMAAWYVALSNFRLAPIQVCCPGHPASTFSKVMDYMVSDGDLFGNPGGYTEHLVGLPVGGARYIGREGFVPPAKGPLDDRTCRIAIPAMAVKIIPPFLEALQRIAAKATRKVEYHFFPNQVSTNHWLVTKDLHRWFPDAVVWPRTTYDEYMKNLAACDFVCSTFPFGGTNSMIDALLAKVPTLCIEGDEIHKRSDASMIRRAKMPEWWICKTVDEYVDKAVQLASGHMVDQVADNVISVEFVQREFYGDGPPEVKDAFLKAFEQIYEGALDEQERRVSEAAGRASAGA